MKDIVGYKMKYDYLKSESKIREQATMKEPAILDELQFENITNEGRIAYLKYRNDYKEHIASLQTFPVIGKPDCWPDIVEEFVHFKFDYSYPLEMRYGQEQYSNVLQQTYGTVAIPIEQSKEDELTVDLILADKSMLIKKVMFYREQTDKLRKYITDNKIGKPSQGFFDAILEHLQSVEQLKGVEQEHFLAPDGENDWVTDAPSFSRKEVFNLLWTQRAMISNDIKSLRLNTSFPKLQLLNSKDVYDVLENPRTPKF